MQTLLTRDNAVFQSFFLSVEVVRRHLQTTRGKGTPTQGPYSDGAKKRNQRPRWPVPGLHLPRSLVSKAGILFLVFAVLCVCELFQFAYL